MVRSLVALAVAALPLAAQLTRDQKQAEIRTIADLLARRYAPLEWKRAALDIDLLNIAPWLDRVGRTQDDLGFYEVLCEYVASLKDTHTAYSVPSSFFATLGFTADYAEGRVVVDAINRDRLPESEFPFQVGDEVVSIDGINSEELLNNFLRFVGEGNPNLARRSAASFFTTRDQSSLPRAHEIQDTAVVVIRRAAGTATYTMPWRKQGVAVTTLPSVPQVRTAGLPSADDAAPNEPNLYEMMRQTMRGAGPVQDRTLGVALRSVVGLRARAPAFALPDQGFTLRQSSNRTDLITSGVFESGGLKIGYVRIPHFDTPAIQTSVVNEFRALRDLSDGLIVDVMRNPGGAVCVSEEMQANLFAENFNVHTVELRVGWADYLGIKDFVDGLRDSGIPEASLTSLDLQLRAYEDAVKNARPRTAGIPVCGVSPTREAPRDRLTGQVLAYSKPVVVLIDDWSISAAESFASVMQDNGRALLVGTRTAGAGATVTSSLAGYYGDGAMSVSRGLVVRSKQVSVSGFPATSLIENVGVRPDVELDFMTRENLAARGKPFLDKLLEIAADHINKNKK
jgi:C-terminal processing protease CtpA/Prc